MRTKIKFFLVSCIIALTAITGFNLVRENKNMDVTLADIALMAKADDPENPSDKWHRSTCNCYYNGIYKIEYFTGVRYICWSVPIGDDSCSETNCSTGSWCV